MRSKGDGGVYVFRGRRPGLLGRLPLSIYLTFVLPGAFVSAHFLLHDWRIGAISLLLSPRHTLYVGEGRVHLRREQHLRGSKKWGDAPKPWGDLRPSFYSLRLPYVKWLLRSVETVGIVLLAPVYNKQKNQWNPRRIPLETAKLQRGQRDRWGWSFNFRFGHAVIWLAVMGIVFAKGWVG